ncbi:hypothetical protein [Pseudomonas sp. 1152_12]|uniref:hypothetical protein n=1 Tax=Pseudomonas sp. 1152_12 TaxID=2604455 RepID=UPI0040636987
MNPSEAPVTDSFRYFAIGVVCVAVLLGGYFVHFNAQVDRERAEAVERMALCRKLERMTRAASSISVELRDTCQPLNGAAPKSVAP